MMLILRMKIMTMMESKDKQRNQSRRRVLKE